MPGLLRKISLNQAVNDSYFQQKLDSEELLNLQKQYPDYPVYHVEIDFGEHHFNYFNGKKNRRGEVVVLLQNLQDRYLLHTKPQFPNSIYRLLSGGIRYNESLDSGLAREVFEETGFHFTRSKFIGLVLYRFIFGRLSMPFISYLFTVNGINGEPSAQDKSENISGFKWVEKHELGQVYRQLLTVPEEWKDWGLLRAIPHKIFYENYVNK